MSRAPASRSPLRPLLGRALASVLAVFLPAALAADLSAEERLAALRHSLTQQSLQGATQVTTTSWIDEQGALRESSSFRTGMQVRGVRVVAYSRNAQGEPQAQLQVHGPQDMVKAQTPAKPEACPSHPSLRHVLALQMQARGRWPIDEEHLRRDAAQVLGLAWSEPLASANWQVVQLPSAAAPSAASPGTYERLLTGGASPTPSMGWQLQLDMEALPPPQPWVRMPWMDLVSRVRLKLSLLGPRESRPLWQRSAEVLLKAQTQALSAPRLREDGRQQLQKLVRDWAQLLSERLACEPVQVQVTRAQPDRLQIDQGAMAGVRAGDEWLISDRRRWPGRMLEPDAAASLVLARVEQVSEHRAQLQVLAGPAAAVRPNWQAWPVEKAH